MVLSTCLLLSLALVAGVPEIESGPRRVLAVSLESGNSCTPSSSWDQHKRHHAQCDCGHRCAYVYSALAQRSKQCLRGGNSAGAQDPRQQSDREIQKDSGINDLEDHLALVETLHVDREKTAAEVQSQEERTF